MDLKKFKIDDKNVCQVCGISMGAFAFCNLMLSAASENIATMGLSVAMFGAGVLFCIKPMLKDVEK